MGNNTINVVEYDNVVKDSIELVEDTFIVDDSYITSDSKHINFVMDDNGIMMNNNDRQISGDNKHMSFVMDDGGILMGKEDIKSGDSQPNWMGDVNMVGDSESIRNGNSMVK